MFWKRKRRNDVLNLVPLEKIRKREQEKVATATSNIKEPSPQSDSSLGFFGAMSGAAESPPIIDTATNNYFSSQESEVADKSRLEELENRMDSLSRRISSLMDRIDLMEKKVRRIEEGRI